jgi:hypothetical protein
MGILDFRSTLSAQQSLGRNSWPPASERETWAQVELLSAFRTSNETLLKQYASIPWNYPYAVTPIPRMISRASAGMLFGEPPEIGDDDDGDATRVQYIVEQNGLDAEFVRAALMSSSEGDVFGRVMVRPDLLDVPIIDYSSRANVIPEFTGRFLRAATFVTQWREGSNEVFRLLERHSAGLVEHSLWRGTNTSKGQQVQLDSYPRTAGMADVVRTGFDYPLCVFIPNTIDADPTRGFSDYRGLEQRFLNINEEEGIGHANVVLTGQKRALIDGRYVGSNGKPTRLDNVLIRTSDDATAGETEKPLSILEYSFEAQELVKWVDHMIDLSILAAGMSPQLVGRNVDSGAISGTAMRLKMAHALIENGGKGRYMDRGNKRLLQMAKIIDSRRTTEGGFGRSYKDVLSVPSLQRADALPRDDMEAAQRVVLLTNAEAISTEEKVRLVNPDWSEDQITDEVARIEDESAPPSMGENAMQPGTVPVRDPGTERPAITLPPGGAEPGAAS